MGGYCQGKAGETEGHRKQQWPAEPGLAVIATLVIDVLCLTEDVGHYWDSPGIGR